MNSNSYEMQIRWKRIIQIAHRALQQREQILRDRLLRLPPATSLSFDEVRNTLRQFAEAWEFMTEAERHEVVSLAVKRVDVKRQTAFDIHLYVPDLSVRGEWLPVYSNVQISAKVVALPGEGITVADLSLGG